MIDISIFITQFGTQGYLSCDFDGDGDVNASDVQIIAQNFGLTTFVPGLDPVSPEIRKQKIDAKKKELNELLIKAKQNKTQRNN